MADTGIELPALDMQNDSGADIAEGDAVVVLDDGTIAKTTTIADGRPSGIALDDIDDGESGPVQFLGPVDLIHVVGAVTGGNFGRTSALSGLVEEVTDPAGAFVYFTSDGTEPEGFVLAPSAGSPAGGSSSSGGGMVPYYIPVDETFTVPLYKQGLFSEAIEVDGGLVVNGLLLGVD